MGFFEAIIGDNPVQWLFVGIINNSNKSNNSGNNNSTSTPS